ncbi:hypothetical protein BO94DRAFT_372936 [Aspergillus sclerotioniger CBS 115572]|uniref:Uncharacterized protein n=1 Tax=Aspergillus sclerotioniger CBS 115572 TaxID=1450535 RepID=A0A317X8Y3_9EURO|nr:hypothetical protein BO94DRAFT_372936 [Aspergillus sclerotioniger CBS 115572]PWY93358.1 hypothetical protein BO94DRAFT_372936 [Aspergillus sclerotioniger CBS 115572]
MTNIMDPIDDPSYNVEATEHTFGTSASDSHRSIDSYNSENKTGNIADTVDRGIGDDRHGRTSDISSTASCSQTPTNTGRHGQAPRDIGAQYSQSFSPSCESQHGIPGSANSSHGTHDTVSTTTAESQPSHAKDKTGARIGGGRDNRPDATKEKEGPIEGTQDNDVTGEKVNGIAGVIPISGSAGPTTTKTFDPHAEIGNYGNNGPHSSATASKNDVSGDQDAPASQYDTASSSYNTLGSDYGQSTTDKKNSRAGSGLAGARAVESRRDM